MGYCTWGLPFAPGGWFFGHGPFGLLLIVLLAVLLVVVLTRLARTLFVRDRVGRDARDSEDILRQRFARGEISAEEYQRMREILSR